MRQVIDRLREQFTLEISQAASSKELEDLKVRYLGRKGPIQDLMKELKELSPEDKPLFGKEINDLKEELSCRIEEKANALLLAEENLRIKGEAIDITLPGRSGNVGFKHIITIALEEIIDCLVEMGFSVQFGPVIESDWYNFGALNHPEHHPARSMQDTFYLDPETLLRTHTSNIQVRLMEKSRPPIRIIAPGKVFRNEEINARSHVFFHQVEGLYIDKGVTFTDLLGTMNTFFKRLLGSDVALRYRPSYFPFVEPGLEVDVSCIGCKGSGCPLCKHTGWLEVAGAGMVHPDVMKNGGIDPEEYTGYAWGMGVERLVMLKYGVPDIRMFVENDMRFLNQFAAI